MRRAYDDVQRAIAGPIARPKIAGRGDATPLPTRNFERALELLRARRWSEARPLLVELAASAPNDVRYRAYLHYVRGWESFELGKDGEARAEWQRALACDPGLGMAQWALGKTGLG
jgi:predicted Zn-dependent protease